MSEWGRVVFYYDYELKKEYEDDETNRIRGIISKAYKYPGIYGLMKHGIDGYRYFLEQREMSFFDIDTARNYLGKTFSNSYEELNAAFDVLWDIRRVSLGVDDVKRVVEDALSEDGPDLSKEDDFEIGYDMFACEGTDGYFFITYTGNPTDGYVAKYGYYCGYATVSDKFMDARTAAKIYLEHQNLPQEEIIELLEDEFFEYIDQNLTLFESEEEFWGLEKLGVDWLRDLQKTAIQDRKNAE